MEGDRVLSVHADDLGRAESLNRRTYPSGMTATLRFAVEGSFLADNDGGYELTVAEGRAQVRIC